MNQPSGTSEERAQLTLDAEGIARVRLSRADKLNALEKLGKNSGKIGTVPI
jgi:hypothetical protein